MDDNAEGTQVAEISHALNSRTAIEQATSIWNIDRKSTWRQPIPFSKYKSKNVENTSRQLGIQEKTIHFIIETKEI